MVEKDLQKELILLLSELSNKLVTYVDIQSSSIDNERKKCNQLESKIVDLQSKLDAAETINVENKKQLADLYNKNGAIEISLSKKDKQIKELHDEITQYKMQLGIEKDKTNKFQKKLTVIEETVKEVVKEKEAANAAKVETEELAHQYKRQYEDLATKLKEAPEQGVREFFAKVNQDGYSLARLWNADAKSNKGATNAFRDALLRLGIQCKGIVGEEVDISSDEDLQRFRMHVSAPALPFRAQIISPGFTYRNRTICLPEIDPI